MVKHQLFFEKLETILKKVRLSLILILKNYYFCNHLYQA